MAKQSDADRERVAKAADVFATMARMLTELDEDQRRRTILALALFFDVEVSRG